MLASPPVNPVLFPADYKHLILRLALLPIIIVLISSLSWHIWFDVNLMLYYLYYIHQSSVAFLILIKTFLLIVEYIAEDSSPPVVVYHVSIYSTSPQHIIVQN